MSAWRGMLNTVLLAVGAGLVMPAAAAGQGAAGTDGARLQTEEARKAQDEFDRRAVQRLLHRPEVRDAASRAGVDVDQAEDAVSELDRRELRRVGERARELNDALDIGGDKVVIPTTTLIIALLVLIVILVA